MPVWLLVIPQDRSGDSQAQVPRGGPASNLWGVQGLPGTEKTRKKETRSEETQSRGIQSRNEEPPTEAF